MIVFNDIETSGLRPWQSEIITSYFIVTDDNLEVVDEREFRFKPTEKFQWSSEAAAVHGYSWRDAQLFPDKAKSTSSLCDWLKSHGTNFSYVCHALPFASRVDLFDYQHLFAHFWCQDRREDFHLLFPEEKVRSTVIKSKKQAQQKWGIENQKLDTWAKRLGFVLRHHNAESDTRACLQVYKYQQEVALNGME